MHRKKCTRMAQCRIKMHKLLIRDCLNLIYFYAFLSLTRYLWVTLVVVMVSCKGREPWGIHSSSVMDNQQDIHCCNQQTTGPTLWLAGCLSVCTSINLRTNQTELLHEGLSLHPLLHSVPTDPQSVCPLQPASQPSSPTNPIIIISHSWRILWLYGRNLGILQDMTFAQWDNIYRRNNDFRYENCTPAGHSLDKRIKNQTMSLNCSDMRERGKWMTL